MREDYNRSVPADDLLRYSSQIRTIVEKVTQPAGSAIDPAEYANISSHGSAQRPFPMRWIRKLPSRSRDSMGEDSQMMSWT